MTNPLLLLVLAAIPYQSAPSPTILPRLNFQPNTAYTVQNTTTSTSQISGALEATMTQKVATTSELKILTQEEGWFNTSTTVNDVNIESEGEMPGFDLDSVIAKLKDVKTDQQVNVHGQTRSLKITGDPEVTGTMNMDALTMMGFMGIELPANEVKVGESWTVDRQLKFDANAEGMVIAENGTLKSTYKLASLSTEGPKTASIEFTSDVVINVSAMGQQGKSIAKVVGKATFNLETGMFETIETTTDNNLDLGMIAVTSQSKSTAKIVKK